MADERPTFAGEPDFNEDAHHARQAALVSDPAAWSEHLATQAQLEEALANETDPIRHNAIAEQLAAHRAKARRVGGMTITAERM